MKTAFANPLTHHQKHENTLLKPKITWKTLKNQYKHEKPFKDTQKNPYLPQNHPLTQCNLT